MVAQLRTSTRAINPAFLQEIKDSNPELWATIHKVRDTVTAPPRHWAEQSNLCFFVHLLNELRDHLALQFSLEESYGYLECQVSQGAEMGDRIREALAQHRLIYLTATDLCDLAEDMQYRGMLTRQAPDLFAEVRKFDVCFRQHEQLESEIIELAYFDQRR